MKIKNEGKLRSNGDSGRERFKEEETTAEIGTKLIIEKFFYQKFQEDN